MLVFLHPRVSFRVAGFPVASPCLWGKPQNLSFSKVSKQVVISFCVAGVALCDIPTCFLPCHKLFCEAGATRCSSLYTVALHSTRYSTLYTPHSTLYTPHSTLYTLHSTLHTLHSTLYTLHTTLYTLHSSLHTLHSTLSTPCFTLHTLHFPLALHILHLALHTPQFTL